MNSKIYRTGAVAAAAIFLIIHGQEVMAQDIDFDKATDTGNQIIGFLRGPLATIIFVLAFAVTGFLAAMNRISWVWVGGVILGAVLVFGGPAFVDSLRSILE
ncbi:type IV secretory pathway VirB2 component (pilin) [Primorskyibacter sedentarius]|uniref:Type IV secretory pathway VirB2 component (Pilin) n=1 Tax=Primorskyibacter sedentarius TaxID=745311 RepID=A0A4R3IXE6_9RHOB|nr:TrbC/VirB2 family protein [Primorskyibacter sedentarius]TCS55278.1 type IV secretory pathway VirB2 component (pilin) [Primorskyibacter sedentarius]